MKTPPDKTVTFTYVSHPTKSLKMRWQAKLTFPAGADETTLLELAFEDGEGEPVASGTFEFAGQQIAVRDGKATLAYADFVKGKHDPGVWLHRKGMLPIPGSLTFA